MLGVPIDDNIANLVIAQLLYLESEGSKKDIFLYINSPGGYATSGLAVYDTMQFIKCDVSTICIGQASSAAALLLAAGAKGKRLSLPHARILIHQPSGSVQGQATDIGIHAKEILSLKEKMNSLIAKHTGQPLEKIEKDTDRDFFMTPEEAKKYGIIDEIIHSKKPARPDVTCPSERRASGAGGEASKK